MQFADAINAMAWGATAYCCVMLAVGVVGLFVTLRS